MSGTLARVITLWISVGRPNRPFDRRQRRLGADDAALALKAFQQRGFFAADVGSGALAHFNTEAAEEIAGRRQRRLQRGDGMRIFGTHVDVAAIGADRATGNRHAFEQAVGVALHQHAIGEGAGIAFVGIADHVFLPRRGVMHGAPLDAGGKGRAAAPAQAGIGDRLHDRARRHGARRRRPSPPPRAT
jgi:hypothetical protein